jgi:hypothetical protein
MTQYDKEFEAFWNNDDIKNEDERLKRLAYTAWQAALIVQSMRTPQQPEVNTLKLAGGDWYISTDNKAIKAISSTSWRKIGRERKTRELAEAAAEKMRKRDRLHAFATEFMGREYKFVDGEENTFLYFDHLQGEWSKSSDKRLEIAGTIYMTYKCAEYLCAALNDESLVL